MKISYPQFSTSRISLQPEANSKSLLKLSKNEVVEGKVLRTFSSDNALLLIKGRRVMARSYVPLKEGKILYLQVEETAPTPTLKLLGTLVSKKIGGAASLDKLMQGDLKGLVSRLVALNEKKGTPLKRFVSGIKNIQLLNHPGLEQDRKIFIPIPIQFPDGLFTLGQLLIHLGQKEKNGSTRKKIDENPFRITFLLELSNLGPLRADLSIKGKEIRGTFLITKEEIKFFIKNNIPSLINKLKGKGFTVSSIECHLKDHEIVKQSLVEEIIHQEGNAISLVA